MNQNAELVKRLEKHASFCEKDGQRIVARNLREAAFTISTQERVIVELEKLAKFGDAVLEEARDSLSDLDGGWLQDKAEEIGLLIRVEVTEPCGELCHCAEYGDFPQDCLRRTSAMESPPRWPMT